MSFYKCLLPLAVTLGAIACGASDFEPEDVDAQAALQAEELHLMEVPVAGATPDIEGGHVEFCGSQRMKVTGGDLETVGGLVPNGLKGTITTSGGTLKLDVKLSVDLFHIGSPKIVGGTASFGDKTVELQKSTLTMDMKGLIPLSLKGTVKAKGCPKGLVLSVEFAQE